MKNGIPINWQLSRQRVSPLVGNRFPILNFIFLDFAGRIYLSENILGNIVLSKVGTLSSMFSILNVIFKFR